jgi:ABC-type antimicrobial peptide transport system permease subunit
MKIFGFLGTLAITIACLGLLGIAVYSMQLRVKEVGIRKVMGATELGLVGLLSRNFLAMMAIAICIGVPIAYFFFNLVLLPLNYYHTKVGVLEIFYSIVLMTGLGLLMIGSQTLKAATSNPAEVLRNE